MAPRQSTPPESLRLKGDYDKARENFEAAARMKVADAPAALEQLDKMQR